MIRFALAEESEEEFWQTDRSALSRIVDRRRRASEKYFDEVAGRLEKITPWPFLGCHWSLPSSARAQNHDCRFGGRGGHDLAIVGGESEESILHRQLKEHGSDWKRTGQKEQLVELELQAWGYRKKLPLPTSSVDLALMSQSLHHAQRPEAALSEAFRILKKNGQLVILDLKKHQFEKARELYGDQWLGFAENQLYRMIKEVGFRKVKVQTVAKEGIEPYFETILACGDKLS